MQNKANFYIFYPPVPCVVVNSFFFSVREIICQLEKFYVWLKSTAGKGGLCVSDWLIERENEMKTNYMIAATHT